MIFGRKEELKLIATLKNSPKAELLVLYGRRRIGKSTLIQHFCCDWHAIKWWCEGIPRQSCFSRHG